MGLFSSLFGNKDKATLEELSSQLEGGSIRYRSNDQVWEWRGSVGHVSARVWTGGPSVEAWLKASDTLGSFTLERNPALIKDAGDSPEDAWSEDEVVRVFVGPGMYLESLAFVIGEEASAFQSLPGDGAKRLEQAMSKCEVGGVNTQPGEWLVRFEPKASTSQIVEFMGLVASIVSLAPGDPTDPQNSAPNDLIDTRMRCGYCRCIFLLGVNSNCPNCGGPADA